MPTKPFQAVIFDFDDTLLDDTASTRAGLAALAEAHQLSPDPARLFARHAEIINDLSPLLFRGEINGHQARVLRFERLLTELGVPQPDGEAANQIYRAAYKNAWALCEGAAETLQTLRGAGYRLGLLTNYVREVQVEKIDQFGLGPYFDAMLFAGELPAPKPDVRAFWAACEALGVAPQQAVMVGDSLKNDVQGALAAGLRAVWLNRYAPDQAGVYSIQQLLELPPLLLTMR